MAKIKEEIKPAESRAEEISVEVPAGLSPKARQVDCTPAKSLEYQEKGKLAGYDEVKGKAWIIPAVILAIGLAFGGVAFAAESTDESVLGNNRWSVQNDGDIVPNADSSYDIGAVGSEISNIYADTVTATTTALTGDAVFKTSLIANGRYAPSGVSTSITLASSSTGLGGTSVPYTVIIKNIGGDGVDITPGSILPDGIAGQELMIITNGVGSGTCQWLLTPTTTIGFTSITFTATKQYANLIYDATLGWIIKATNATINL